MGSEMCIRDRVEPKLEADTYVLSYPKSGRTWMRALLGKALVDHYHLSSGRLLELEEVTRLAGLPVATFYHDGSAMLDGLSWRDLRSDKSEYRDKRVLLLGRDVRDTLVSAYFHATRRLGIYEGTISSFIRDERYGADKVIVAATHAILSGPAAERLNSQPFEEIIFTNTLPIPPGVHVEKATVLSVAPLLAQAIHEVFEDGSVASLFDGGTQYC